LSRRDEPAGSLNCEDAVSAAPSDPDPPHEAAAPAADSVLAQWQQAMAENSNQPRPPSQPRPSRREQRATISEQPFVRRAMELFDVPPDKLRYTPPDDSSIGIS
jgi:hypothetical protein